MSASVAEQILARIAAVLDGATRAASNVHRARTAPFGQDEIPAINITRLPTESRTHGNQLVRHLLSLEIELHEQGESWEPAVDSFHMEIHDVLSRDSVLAALGRDLLCTGTETLAGEADFIAGRLTARYQMQFLTRPGDLTRSIN